MNPSRWVQFSRVSFSLVAWIFIICITVQVLVAGLALFVNPLHWSQHAVFARLFFFLPLVMAVLAYFAQLSSTTIWRCIGLFGMMIGLFFTAAIASRVGILAALHPVIALTLFYNCMKTIRSNS